MSDPTVLQVMQRKISTARVRLRSAILSQRFGFSPSVIYDEAFFDGDTCQQGRAAALAVAEILFEKLCPSSVFDFGCGRGALLEAFTRLGVEASGCEGSTHGVRRCPPSSIVFQQDLKQPVALNRKFDLAICIEVAEHLPARCAPTLADSIAAAAANDIVFSASGPGQLGDDHINLQPPSYWIDLFEQRGFVYREAESVEVRAAFTQAGVPQWFQNTIMLVKSA